MLIHLNKSYLGAIVSSSSSSIWLVFVSSIDFYVVSTVCLCCAYTSFHYRHDDIASHSIPFYSHCRRNITHTHHIKNNYDEEDRCEREDEEGGERERENRTHVFYCHFNSKNAPRINMNITATQLFIDDILTDSHIPNLLIMSI